jgi:hypothetical protein
MRRGDGSGKTGPKGVQATWKVVEDIFRNGEPSPETDARLLEQFQRLLAEPAGLAVLTDHVRHHGPWRSGNPFLNLLSQAASAASQGAAAAKHRDALERLAVTIIKSTEPDDRPHQAMLATLSRLDGEAYLDAVRRSLFQLWERDRQRDALAVVRGVLGPGLPQREWPATLKRLLEKTADAGLKSKLREALQQLGGETGQVPAEAERTGQERTGTGAVSGRERVPSTPAPHRDPDSPAAEPAPAMNGEPSAADARSEHLRSTALPASGPSASGQAVAAESQDDRADARPLEVAQAEPGRRTVSPPAGLGLQPADPSGPAPGDRDDGPQSASSGGEVIADGPETAPATAAHTRTDEPPPRGSAAPSAVRREPSGPARPDEATSPPLSAVRPEAGLIVQPGPPAGESPERPGAVPQPVPEPPSPRSGAKPKSPRPKRTKASPPAGEEAVPTTAGTSVADLKAYLAEVTQKITGLFRDHDSDRQEFLAQCARTEKDNNRLREQLAEAESRAEAVASALEAARATSAEQLARISALEAQLEASREAARKAEERARQLDKDLEDALREIEETERRAGDKVHRAEKEKELGVRTFRFELKKRIQPYLTEVLDDGGEPLELSPDQSRLHQRLRKILGVLRDTGVMGE